MKKMLLLLGILPLFCLSYGQEADSTKTPSFFSGTITATNNGISLIPSFSLNKPAALFDLSMGKGRWSFDPMLRFNMNGKPWSFIFWGRYKAFDTKKFKMSIGAHPSFVFREVTITTNTGEEQNYLNAQRYFAWEATPTYFPNEKIGFGIAYLGSRGLTNDIVRNTTFLAIKSIMPHISLNKKFFLTLIPQVFYLRMDDLNGTYVSAYLGISMEKFPISITSTMSKKIRSDIAGKDFLWNIAANYNFNNKYNRIDKVL